MENFDSQKAARVWSRVQGHSAGLDAQQLPELIAREQNDANTYFMLSRRMQGRDSVLLRQMAQQEQDHAACLKGLYVLITGTQPVVPVLPTIAIAGIFATISYLFYYKAIARIGASKAMALNVTYSAWAIVFTVLILRDTSVLTPLTIACAVVVLVCGIFAAADFKEIFKKK